MSVALVAVVGIGSAGSWAQAEDIFAPPKMPAGDASRVDFGAAQLDRLPWRAHVLQANLGTDRPVAIAGCYLMQRHLLVVSQSGLVYCLDRQNLEPRWVSSLKAPLFRPPSEGATHFVFVTKDYRGAYWLHAISKRSGSEGPRFPKRLGFSASSGAASTGSMAYVGSLGSPSNNKLFESINLVSGRGGWGYTADGLIYGSPQADPVGANIVFATDAGTVTSVPGSVLKPEGVNWERKVGGIIKGGLTVTPEHVVVGNTDGLVWNLDLDNGRVLWVKPAGAAITSKPYVVGGYQDVSRDSGVDGAEPITVREYVGVTFVRNVKGLHAFDIKTGEPLFSDPNGGRPLCRQGRWLVTIDPDQKATFRDAEDGYEVKGRLDLGMLDLLPSNGMDGAIYGCTADGGIVVAVPR